MRVRADLFEHIRKIRARLRGRASTDGKYRDEGRLASRLIIVGPTNEVVNQYLWRVLDHAADLGHDITDLQFPEYFKCRGDFKELNPRP